MGPRFSQRRCGRACRDSACGSSNHSSPEAGEYTLRTRIEPPDVHGEEQQTLRWPREPRSSSRTSSLEPEEGS